MNTNPFPDRLGVWPDSVISQWLPHHCFPSDNVKVNPNSLDLSLSPIYQRPRWWWRNRVTRRLVFGLLREDQRDICNKDNEALYWTPKREFSRLVIWPGEFYLCATHEQTIIPPDVCPFLFSKSSTGRMGLEHLHAGLGDAGFNGTWTLELKNLGDFPIVLYPYKRYFQLVFIPMMFAADIPYNGRYQFQGLIEPGPTPARKEKK